MSTHTAGPWKVEPGYYPGFLEVKGASFKISIVTIATDLDSKDFMSRTADAHLIASAPTLLSTLELVKRRLNTCLCDEVEMGEGTMNRLFEEVSEAISLAKGEKE